MRVDAARVLYLHRYGGVYMDLDVESTAPMDQMFENVESMMRFTIFSEENPWAADVKEKLQKRAPEGGAKNTFACAKEWVKTKDMGVVLASLGPRNAIQKWPHSVPNAWMASRPGHPFWLYCLNAITNSFMDPSDPVERRKPEFVAGPVMLHRVYFDYITDCERDPVFILDK
ncbi:hypothetical protein HK102_006576, partial [Quaeritorhiza haematococci]